MKSPYNLVPFGSSSFVSWFSRVSSIYFYAYLDNFSGNPFFYANRGKPSSILCLSKFSNIRSLVLLELAESFTSISKNLHLPSFFSYFFSTFFSFFSFLKNSFDFLTKLLNSFLNLSISFFKSLIFLFNSSATFLFYFKSSLAFFIPSPASFTLSSLSAISLEAALRGPAAGEGPLQTSWNSNLKNFLVNWIIFIFQPIFFIFLTYWTSSCNRTQFRS